MPQFRLKENSFTWAAAIAALEAAGYVVNRRARKQHGSLWTAESATLELVAEDPLKLLGLVKLHELRGADWRATPAETAAIFLKHKLKQIKRSLD